MTKRGFIKGIEDWARNHPDVWEENEHGTSHWWWVQNLLGTLRLLKWEDLQKIHKKLSRK